MVQVELGKLKVFFNGAIYVGPSIKGRILPFPFWKFKEPEIRKNPISGHIGIGITANDGPTPSEKQIKRPHMDFG